MYRLHTSNKHDRIYYFCSLLRANLNFLTLCSFLKQCNHTLRAIYKNYYLKNEHLSLENYKPSLHIPINTNVCIDLSSKLH